LGALRGFFIGGFDWNGSAGRGPVLVGLATLFAIVLAAPRISALTGGVLSPRQVYGAMVAVIYVQLLGTIVRRLHDAGRSGWWLLLAIVPYMPPLMMLALLVLPAEPGASRLPANGWRRLGFALTAVLACIELSRLFWIDHLVESAHMEPSLLYGDFVAATTLFRPPERGEVVIFAPPGARPVAMRVIGLPGERVAQRADGLEIDDQPVAYAPTAAEGVQMESLPGDVAHPVRPGDGGFARVAEIPPGYVLLLGDNRAIDAAFASEARLAGRIVPFAHVRARVGRILYSSAVWGSGVPAWLSNMRWARVWSLVQ